MIRLPNQQNTELRRGALGWAAMMALVCSGAAQHGTAMDVPSVDMATTIVDKRGTVVPPDLKFVDENGKSVVLGDYFGDRPLILNLGYYGCPALCGVVTNGMVAGLQELDLELGPDYTVVTVSIDPKEEPPLAREKKNSYLALLKKDGAEANWHFLTGDEDQIQKLADTVGFNFQWNPFGKQYDHSAGIMVLSPDGTLSQVLQGVEYSGRTMRLALVEASDGVVGTAWDRILLTCYGYDPLTREYGLLVWTVVRIGGALTILGIGTMLFVLWRREKRRVDTVTA